MRFPDGNADTLTITAAPTSGWDLTLVVYCNTVSSSLSDGLAIDDTGVVGVAESVTVGGITPGTSLYILVDGYSTGGAPPGPSGPYTLSVTSSGSVQPVPCGATPEADLSITKDDGVTTVTAGTSTVYTITASNAGPDDVTGATVADNFPAACTSVSYTAAGAGGATGYTTSGTGNISDTALNLPSGSSVTYTATCNIDPAATGTLANTATISSAVDDPNTANDSATDTDTILAAPSADLSITKDDGVTTVTAGTSTVYTITASNAGPSGATGTSVTDTFPAACTSVSYTAVGAGGATGYTTSGTGNISDTALDLPSGSTVTYTATCNIAAGATGPLANTATISSQIDDPNTANNSATDTDTIVAPPDEADLSVTLTDAPDPVEVGDAITYTAVIANAGPDAATAVSLSIPLPAEMTFASIAPGGGSCTTPAVGASGTVACTWASLGPSGGSDTVVVTAEAATVTGPTGATATATVSSETGDPNTANNTATALTVINEPTGGPGGVELAPAVAVPTLSGYMTALLGTLLGLLGFAAFRRRS